MYLLVIGQALTDGAYALHFGALQGGGMDNQAYPFVIGDAKQEYQSAIAAFEGNDEQAVKAAQRAVKHGTEVSKPYSILAFHYLRQGKEQDALKFLNEAAQRGLGKEVGGMLIVKSDYGELTVPVQDITSVSSDGVSTKYDEVFKGKVEFVIE